MSKRKILKNVPIFCLTLTNLALSVKYGWNWLSICALVLSVIVLIWDVVEVSLDGKKRN